MTKNLWCQDAEKYDDEKPCKFPFSTCGGHSCVVWDSRSQFLVLVRIYGKGFKYGSC
jgi:hypothetical protein